MPKVRVTSPDGRTAVITAPEGATEDEIRAFAEKQFSSSSTKAREKVSKDNELGLGKGLARFDSTLFGFGNEALAGLMSLMDVAGKDFTLQDFPSQFKKHLATQEGLTNQFKSEKPLSHAANTVVPAMIMGGGATSLLKPQTIKSAIALGAGEGAIFGAGETQGDVVDRLKGAGKGAVFGAGGTAAAIPVQAAGRSIPKVYSKTRELFTGKPPGVSDVDEGAYEALALFTNRGGRVDKLANRSVKAEDTVTDVLDSPSLLAAVSAHNDESANLLRKGNIADRLETDDATGYLRTQTGLDESIGDKGTRFHDALVKGKKNIGGRIEERIIETSGEPLNNQEALHKFLSLKKNRGLLKKAIADLEVDGLEPRYNEEAAEKLDDLTHLLDGFETGDDVNALVIDEATAQAINTHLGSIVDSMVSNKIKVTPSGDMNFATASKLKRQWDDLITEGASDDTLKSLRKSYGSLSRLERAYRAGVEQYNTLPLSELKRYTRDLSAKELNAFRKGVATHISDRGDNLVSRISSGDEKRKLRTLFGENAVENMSQLVADSQKRQRTAEALEVGLRNRDRETVAQTLAGKTQQAPESLMERLSNKRAYSKEGGVFLLANEVVQMVQDAGLPDEVVVSIAKLLDSKGADAEKVLKKLAEVDLPALEKKKLLENVTRMLRRSTSAGIGAGTGAASSLMQNVSGEDI